MKKVIMFISTIILTIIAVLATILIVPAKIYENTNVLKNIILLGAGALLIILFYLSIESKIFKVDLKDILILLFLAFAVISFYYSRNKDISLWGEKNRYEGILMIATYICIYIASKKFFKYKNFTTFLNIMFYVSLIIGILGILQNYINYPKLTPIFGKGIAGTFTNSNFFGSYISIVLPVSITIFIFNQNKKCFILSIIMFFNLISSGTRSAWVAFIGVALLGLVYLIKQKNKIFWKNAGLLLIIFCIITIYLFSGIGSRIAKSKANSIKKDMIILSKNGIEDSLGTDRIEIWKMTIKLLKMHPVFGVGPDNLRRSLAIDCTDEFYAYGEAHNCVPDKAHNEYLQIAVTLGIPALVIYISFISIILIPKLKNMNKEKKALIYTLCISSYLIQAFFNISTIGVAPLFWMILGFADNEEINNYKFD